MKEKYFVCRTDELAIGDRKLIQVGRKSIGVFNVKGEFYALLNVCPHQLAPLCEGEIGGYCMPSEVSEYELSRSGEILRCPWHGWEFDITTGRSIFDPASVRTKRIPVQVGGKKSDCAADLGGPDCVEAYEVEVEQAKIYVIV